MERAFSSFLCSFPHSSHHPWSKLFELQHQALHTPQARELGRSLGSEPKDAQGKGGFWGRQKVESLVRHGAKGSQATSLSVAAEDRRQNSGGNEEWEMKSGK